MNIICDTNIWYYIGDKSIIPQKENGNSLIAIFPSIEELFRSDKIFNNTNYVANAIRAIMTNSRQTIRSLPPEAYLKKLDDPTYVFIDYKGDLNVILEITQRIANGQPIEGELKDTMLKLIEYRKQVLQKGATFFNNEADRIKKEYTNKNKPKTTERIHVHREFIESIVETRLQNEKLSKNFDWTQIELYDYAAKLLFHKIEISTMKIQPNDWYDIINLIYVAPGEKYWTREKRWINLIKEAKMEKYLYKTI